MRQHAEYVAFFSQPGAGRGRGSIYGAHQMVFLMVSRDTCLASRHWAMASKPATYSAVIDPMTPIIARRPLFSSMFLHCPLYSPLPAALIRNGSPKLPGSLPSSLRNLSSKKPAASTRTPRPPAPGLVVQASMPAGTFSKPSKRAPIDCTRRPTLASMAMRPGFSSAVLNLRNSSSLMFVESPHGSQYPKGAIAPPSRSGITMGAADAAPEPVDTIAPAAHVDGVMPSLNGDAVYRSQLPQALPVRPS